jgi:Ca-activated chloride channel family protein
MDIANPHFAEPAWLWLAFLGPVAVYALQRYSAYCRWRQLSQVASRELLSTLTQSVSSLRRSIKEGLVLLVIAAIGIALARPQWGERTNGGRMLGEDVVFVLDCSRSMLATDVLPSRLQKAKLAILNYLETYSLGRVGLVAFAGQAFIQCPLTFDYSAFRESLATIDEKTIPVPGTDIGRALDEASRGMQKGDQQKLVILLTDGEDLQKGGIRIAETLREKGMVVFTIGVGTPEGTEISFMNEEGRPALVKDSKGQPVRSQLDETTLRAIAQATGGSYFPLGELGEGLANVKVALSSLDLNRGSAPARKLGVDRFHFPLGVAVFLLATESLIGTRRRVREIAT